MIDDREPRLNILFSFPYAKPVLFERCRERADAVRLVIDSGAFTTWKLGRPIGLDEYCKFIEALPVQPWRYFTLDVVHDPEATWRNYQMMLDRGLRPAPIFTRGEDVKRLDQYYETSDLVGIGGLVGTPGRLGYINGIMPVIGKRRAHLLGVDTTAFIHHHRPYMCDSSSWETGFMYARARLYAGRGQFHTISRDTFRKPIGSMLSSVLNSYGIPPTALTSEHQWHHQQKTGLLGLLATRSIVRYMLDLQKNCGTLLFAAFTASCYIDMLLEAWDDERAGHSVWWRRQRNLDLRTERQRARNSDADVRLRPASSP